MNHGHFAGTMLSIALFSTEKIQIQMWEEKRSKMQIKSPAEILFSPVEQNRTLQELLGNSQRQGQHPISPPVIKKNDD